MKILEIKNLKKTYSEFNLQISDLLLEKGKVLGFVGANGAGKTTTIKLIMNIVKKDEGTISLFGEVVKNSHAFQNSRIGFVYDECSFWGTLLPKQLNAICQLAYKQWDTQLYNKLLADYELDKKCSIRNLSKGMKVKLSLAVALSHHAEFLIMDEPTSGLDPFFRNNFLEQLKKEVAERQVSVLYSTHIMSDLEKIADTVVLIDHGKILLNQNITELLKQYIFFNTQNSNIITENSVSVVSTRYDEKQCIQYLIHRPKSEIIKKLELSGEIVEPTIEKFILAFLSK